MLFLKTITFIKTSILKYNARPFQANEYYMTMCSS